MTIAKEGTISKAVNIHNHDEELLEGLQNNQYSIIILNHSVGHNQLICEKLFKENLFLSVPSVLPLALLKKYFF